MAQIQIARELGRIDIEGLSFRHSSSPILAGVSCTIASGEHVAILGRSGAGKSTLLHLVAGLLKPDAGRIAIDGVPLRHARKPVLMFQRPALLPWLNVQENVLLPLRFSGAVRRDAAAAREKADALIAQIGLTERASALPVNLSGGQQQRVALARALASDPAVLLLDEPFSSLDSETRVTLREDVRALARRRGVTLITVTHDLADAAALADRVLVLAGSPARIEEDIALGSEPEQQLRLRFPNFRDAA